MVTEETEFLSPQSAFEVVERVKDVWGQLTVGPLRQVLARTAAQVDPDAVSAHAEDERARRGLTRRLGSHGTDHWRGDFRVEDARRAWEAVTVRARQLVREGKADTLAMARSDAAMRLILEHSDVKVVVHATRAAADPATQSSAGTGTPCANTTTRSAQTTGATTTPASRPEKSQAAPAGPASASPVGRSAAEDLVEVGGLGAPGTTFVPADWLDDAGTSAPERELACDSDTGALVHGDVPPSLARGQAQARRAHRSRERARERAQEPGEGAVTGQGGEEVVDFSESYRVPDPMARLIRLRDGSCRFPGCSTPARQCDLDHVRPWPGGPTSPINLMCLCRRHHRIKQRHGWTARLHPDGTVTWTDPTGRRTTTWPVDHLHLLTAGHTSRDHGTASRPSPSEIPTTFEEELIELLGGPDHARPRAYPVWFDIEGNTHGGPPPHIDLDSTLEHGLGPWSEILVDIPPPPPRPPDPIPF
ncbi:hypothetical protein ASG74_15505 [Knoellia sp. Soil729]|nr:hypothetical protein ASG74_15505 [Knoellia sp. Soil729]